MSGAGDGADRPSPAKLRRLEEPTGTGRAAAVNRGETARSPAGGRGEGRSARARGDRAGHARGGGGGDARAPPGGGPEMAASAGEGLETPGEGLETPDEDLETPNEGLETPNEGLETPNEGLETPGEGLETPGEGLETPNEDLETPSEGLETPNEELETPNEGLETPNKGLETPSEGLETPNEGLKTPNEELETPNEELETPSEGLETPSEGLETPNEGLETPSEGLETPGEGYRRPKTTGEPMASLETTEEAKGVPETTNTRCLEQEKGDVETTREGLETTRGTAKSLETIERCKGSMETTSKDCLEQEKGDLETTREVTEVMKPTRETMETTREVTEAVKPTRETTEELKIAVTHSSEQSKGVLETPVQSKGSLATTREASGGLGTTKGSLETAVTRCLEHGRRSKGGLEGTTKVLGSGDSDACPGGELKSSSRRKAKTPARPRGSAETSLERERSGKGVLETTREVSGVLGANREVLGDTREVSGVLGASREVLGDTRAVSGVLESSREVSGVLESSREVLGDTRAVSGVLGATREVSGVLESSREVLGATREVSGVLEHTGSPQTTFISHTKRDREQKGGVECPEEGPEPTPTACVGQSRGVPGLPDLTGVPEPAGVPVPKEQLTEESAVISLDEDEEEDEEEQDEGPARYLAALEAVQLELEAVEEEAARAFRRLRARFCLRRRPHLQRRNRLIQHIPGFWVTAFLNHPQLSAMISDRDEDALSYMTSLQVEEFGQSRPGCRIRFFFSVNPYFQNDVVAKEFVRGPSGHLVSHSTPIRWWQGQDPRSRPHKGPPAPRSFFAWFGDHSAPAGDRVAEIIKEELWPNPLQFYLLGEGTEGPPDSEGEDCVVILDDDEDVQEIPDDGDGSGVEEIPTEEPPDPPRGRI